MWLRVYFGCLLAFLSGEVAGLISSALHWVFLALGAIVGVATAEIAERAARRGIR